MREWNHCALIYILHYISDLFELWSHKNSVNCDFLHFKTLILWVTLTLQRKLEELMEQVVFLLQFVETRKKQMSVPITTRKDLKECMRAVLRTVTKVMNPAAYFKGIVNLLGNADGNVKKKVCGYLLWFNFCEIEMLSWACALVIYQSLSNMSGLDSRKLIFGFLRPRVEWKCSFIDFLALIL